MGLKLTYIADRSVDDETRRYVSVARCSEDVSALTIIFPSNDKSWGLEPLCDKRCIEVIEPIKPFKWICKKASTAFRSFEDILPDWFGSDVCFDNVGKRTKSPWPTNASTDFEWFQNSLPDWSCFDRVGKRTKPPWISIDRRGQQHKLKKERDKGVWKFNYILFLKICILLIFNNLIGGTLASRDPVKMKTQMWTENRLSSSTCSLDIQFKAGKCPELETELNIILAHCNFTCPPEEKPICLNTDGGPAYICSPMNLACEAGFRIRVQVDRAKRNVIQFIHEICPKNTYQPVQSACYGACQYLHQINFSDHFLIKSFGDNVSPAILYCNYKDGYFNKMGKSFVSEDTPSLAEFCTNIQIDNPCADEEHTLPLPNGSCVEACPKSYYRDDLDGFTCKPKFWIAYDQPRTVASLSSTKKEFGESNTSIDVTLTPIKLITTTTKKHPTETSTGKKDTTTSKPNGVLIHHEYDATVRVGVYILVAIVFIGGGIFIVVFVCRRQKQKLRRLAHNPDLGNIGIRDPARVLIEFRGSSESRDLDSFQRLQMNHEQRSPTDLKILDEAQSALPYVGISKTDNAKGAALRLGKTEKLNEDATDRNDDAGDEVQPLL